MVVIIGGGIGGLATAIALRRIGLDVEVYERADAVREAGAGIAIWKNAVRALDAIGVADDVRRDSVPSVNAGLRTASGALLTTASTTDLMARFGEMGLVMHRAALHHSLLDALGTGRLHLGKTCIGIDDRGAAGVVARFADGSSVSGEALVGADGLHSIVRAHLLGPAPPLYAGYTSWRAVAAFDHARLVPGESWGRGARFGQVPMSDGRVYWFATHNTPAGGRSPDGERAELLRVFRGWHAPIEELIAGSDPAGILRTDVYDRPVSETWTRARVVLIGDAAHPMTPNLGQGGCQAIEDAVALAQAIQAAPAGAYDRAFTAFEQRRKSRVREIVTASRRIGAIGQWENGAAVWLRNLLVRHLGSRSQMRQVERVIGYDVTAGYPPLAPPMPPTAPTPPTPPTLMSRAT